MFKKYNLNDNIIRNDYNAIKDKLAKKWKYEKNIEIDKTVYFDKNVQISRTEFKKQFPDNKIVYDLSKADYYIANNKPHVWISFYNNSNIIIGKYELEILNKIIDIINNENLIIIESKSIKFKSNNDELPNEMIDKIQLMLQSQDKETLDLGLQILFEYDYEKSIDQFYLLLCKTNPNTFWKRKKSRIIEQKIKNIKNQFTNHNF
jgi:hypothetical protein